MTTLRQEVGGDRPRGTHGHGTGRARDRIAVAPVVEDGKEIRPRREGHHGAVIVGGRAGGPAVDLGGTGGNGIGGHGAVTDAQDARLVDREGEPLQGKGGGDRPRSAHGHGTGRARDRVASAPAVVGGPGGGRCRRSQQRGAIVERQAGGAAVDLCGTGGTRAGG